MPPFIVLLATAALILFLAMLATRQAAKSRRPLRLQRKPVMTAREQQMYQLLQTALPECTALAQVAFSALVTTKGWANFPTQQALRADIEKLLTQKVGVKASPLRA